MKKYTAIVLSAGKGSRMKSEIPKQYMDLLGKPVIYYSLKAFEDSPIEDIVLVTGESDIEYCRNDIVEKYGLSKVRRIVAGGKERYDSVSKGLEAIAELGNCDYVMIHDGARPMLDKEMIERLMRAVEEKEACVPGMPVKDTIKIADDAGFAAKTPDRKKVWLIQTPQTFSYSLICQAYKKLYMDMQAGKAVPPITDDAMVAEYAFDRNSYLVEGSYQNIKITTPEDLDVAALYLSHRQ